MVDTREMVRCYNEHNAATQFAIAFAVDGDAYVMKVPAPLPEKWVGKTCTSSGKGKQFKIRLRVPASAKAEAMANGTAQKVGTTTEVFEQPGTVNGGESFEKFMVEREGGTWVKNSTPFWVAGDMVLDGQQTQLKKDGAEVMVENTYWKLMEGTAKGM